LIPLDLEVGSGEGGDPNWQVAGWLNEEICPPLVLRALSALAMPETEIGSLAQFEFSCRKSFFLVIYFIDIFLLIKYRLVV
jgi:hypothetical protein